MDFFKSSLAIIQRWLVKPVLRGWTLIRDLFQNNSLRKTIVFAMVIVSLLPVLLVGTVSYYRTRVQIQNLVAAQLKQITQNSIDEIETFHTSRRTTLTNLVKNPDFMVTAETISNPKASLGESATAIFSLQNQMVTVAQGVGGEPLFSLIIILKKDGTIFSASDSQFVSDNFGTTGQVVDPTMVQLIGKDLSQTIYSPYRFKNRFVLFTTVTFSLPSSTEKLTAIGITPSLLYSRSLNQSAAFFPGAKAFYYTSDKNIIVANDQAELTMLEKNKSVSTAIDPVITRVQTLQPLSFVSFDKQLVLAYVRNIPNQPAALVLQVPSNVLFGQVPFLDSFILYTLLLALILLGALAYYGTSQLVNPLMHLSVIAKGFAEGKFKARASVNRKDEIGQLAQSMNKMAVDLDTLYTSLEEKVEQRTSQLRTASEVAQLATSSNRLEETLERTVNLLNERFGFYHTSIYLVDETRANLTLKEASGRIGDEQKKKIHRVPFGSQSLVGWVAEHNQARVIQDIALDALYEPQEFLHQTLSEAVLPISILNEVLGVIDIHSAKQKSFDTDMVFVLQTLSNQIAGALQNIRLLQATQVDLAETSLLYRVTRQVTESKNEEEAVNFVIECLPQIPHVNAFVTLDGSNLRILALYDPRSKKLERGLNAIDIPAAKMMEALSAGHPIFIDDITQPSEFDNILSFLIRRSCHSAAILPSLAIGKVSKVLVVGYREDERVNQAILQPFINLAEVIGASLEKFSVLKTLQQRLAELQILANFSQASSAETNLAQLYHILHEQVMQTIGVNLGFIIALFNQRTQTIEFPYAYENTEALYLEPMPIGQGLTSYVIENRKALLLANETERRALELGARIIGKPAKSWLGVPLIVGGDLLGAIILQDQTNEERFSQDDLNLFMTLAPQIATSIRNAHLVHDMQIALQAYDQERLLLNTWLDTTPDAILIKDKNGLYQRISQSAGDELGLPTEKIIGKSDFDLLPRETASAIYDKDMQVLTSSHARIGDIEESVKDGKKQWHVVSRIPVTNAQGETYGVLTLRQNISDVKQAEEYARQRAEEIHTAAEIARDAASILNLDELLGKVVELVRSRFGFYHASVFLLDPLSEYAVLRESTGEAGRQMKLNGHRLAVGSKSIVGQAAARGEPVIIPDVKSDPTHFPNPLLPETRAELAIPLKAGAQVLGTLDVQSDQANSITPEDISILTILADQLASAIHNAQLFAEAEETLGKHRLLQQINIAATTSTSLTESLDRVVNGLLTSKVADHVSILMFNPNQELEVTALAGYEARQLPTIRLPLGKGIIGTAAQERHPIRVMDTRIDPRSLAADDGTLSELALPILFGDELIGVLNLESDRVAAFDENVQEIMGALANNLAAIITNWRLVGQIRRQVDRQQFLFEATSKIRRSVDIPTILQTSINEIGRSMGAYNARISLTTEEAATSSSILANPVIEPMSPPPKGKNGSSRTEEAA